MSKAGLYFQKQWDGDVPNLLNTGIRHWRQKTVRAGSKQIFHFYPARADYSQTRSIRNQISRECQVNWNEKTRKESCRLLFYNNFHDGDFFVTLTFRNAPVDMAAVMNRKHYFIKKLNMLSGGIVKYLGCIETRNSSGDEVRPHLHMVISGAAGEDIRKAWIYGNIHCVRIGESYFDRIIEYMTKTFQFIDNGNHRYIRSRNLIPPDVEILKFDIRDYDDAAAAAEISIDPSKYSAESFPDYEITDAAEYFQSDFLRGFYIRIEMRKKPG